MSSKNNYNPQDYYTGNYKITMNTFKKVSKRNKIQRVNFLVDDIISVKNKFNYLNKYGNEIELLKGYNGIIKHYTPDKNNNNFTTGSYLIRIDEIDEIENTFYFSETELWGHFKVIRRFNKNKKKILCKYYHELGHCKLKDKCPYMHGTLNKKSSKYKKQLCKNFNNGFCPYGINCLYAHGKEQLIK